MKSARVGPASASMKIKHSVKTPVKTQTKPVMKPQSAQQLTSKSRPLTSQSNTQSNKQSSQSTKPSVKSSAAPSPMIGNKRKREIEQPAQVEAESESEDEQSINQSLDQSVDGQSDNESESDELLMDDQSDDEDADQSIDQSFDQADDDDEEAEDDAEDSETIEQSTKPSVQSTTSQSSESPSEETAAEVEEESEPATWASLGLVAPLVDACASLGWKAPTPIQVQSLPHSLAGRDVIGLAETGSGKTGAFGLPMLQLLLANPSPFFGLVLAPTRELAFQIGEQLEALGAGIGVKVCVLVGGVDMIAQAIALGKKPHIICATPGRIVDHLENTKGFSLRSLRYLILDEADRLLNMDFEREIDQILQHIPRARHTMLFSATMTSKVAKLQRASLVDPVKVEVSKKYQTSAGLQQRYVFLPAFHKDTYLAFLCNELHGKSMILFTATCEHAQHVTLVLRHLGFKAIPLHGKMSQPKRLGALNSFKSGAMSMLVATDVASRGLDIPTVDVVMNYDLPTHSKDYIHRVGRTARAGRSGLAITLVSQYDVELFQRIEALLGYKLQAMEGVQSDKVMCMHERVSEAQRIAKVEMREKEDAKKHGGDEDDYGGEDEVETDLKVGAKLSQSGRQRMGGRGGRGGGGGRGGRGGGGGRGGRGGSRGRGGRGGGGRGRGRGH